jgi:hypothetical protein
MYDTRRPGRVDPRSSAVQVILAELRFPAARWQIIAEAQHYGAPQPYLAKIFDLPVRPYRSLTEVVAELDRGSRQPRRPGCRQAEPSSRVVFRPAA